MPSPIAHSRPRHRQALALMAAVLLLSSGPAGAQERQWDVDLVVFEHLDPMVGREVWPPLVDLRMPADALAFDTIEATRLAGERGFTPREAEQTHLATVIRRLRNSSRYRVILTRSWRQPGLPAETALAVRVRGGEDYTGRYATLEPPAEELPWGGGLPAAPPPAAPRRLDEVDGTVTVSLSRYLHLAADLVFRAPLREDGAEPGVAYLQSFAMDQRRRMRSREIHYLDHPRFGVIAMITPHGEE